MGAASRCNPCSLALGGRREPARVILGGHQSKPPAASQGLGRKNLRTADICVCSGFSRTRAPILGSFRMWGANQAVPRFIWVLMSAPYVSSASPEDSPPQRRPVLSHLHCTQHLLPSSRPNIFIPHGSLPCTTLAEMERLGRALSPPSEFPEQCTSVQCMLICKGTPLMMAEPWPLSTAPAPVTHATRPFSSPNPHTEIDPSRKKNLESSGLEADHGYPKSRVGSSQLHIG